VQRRELVRDAHAHLGAVVVGQPDLLHRPDAGAADPHDVALDELARGGEDDPVLARAAAEHRQQHSDQGSAEPHRSQPASGGSAGAGAALMIEQAQLLPFPGLRTIYANVCIVDRTGR
jgi:hypothetical protein